MSTLLTTADEPWAHPFPPDSRLRAASLSHDISAAVRRAAELGSELPSFWRRQAEELERVANSLRAASGHCRRASPPWVQQIAGSVNVVFIAALVDALRYPDVRSVRMCPGSRVPGGCTASTDIQVLDNTNRTARHGGPGQHGAAATNTARLHTHGDTTDNAQGTYITN